MRKHFRKILDKIRNKKNKIQTTGLRLAEVIIIVAATTVIGIVSGSLFTYAHLYNKETEKPRQADINKDLEEISEIYEYINDNYYEDVDREKLVDAAIKAMVDALDDPYATYMNKAEKQQFDERMQGEYYGIGVELVNSTDNKVVIVNVFDETPAQKAGIKVGDIIIELDGKSASGKTSNDIATLIKGSTDRNLTLKVERGTEQLTFNIIKEKVTLKSVTYKTLNKNNNKIGYIDISLFANNTYAQFKNAVEQLEKESIKSLIIDVRNNAGGYLHVTKEMLSLFFDDHTVIYQLATKGKALKYYDETKEKRNYPIAVLINGQSASASEIVASALKENYNAVLVGEKTYGKGTVQQTQDTVTGAMIKFTIQKWLTPKGNWIEGKGVEPTINVTLNQNYYENPSEENDNQLQTALDELTK